MLANTFATKLVCHAQLPADDLQFLDAICQDRTRRVAADEDIIIEGRPSDAARIILAGWACRYKQLPDGRRCIVGLLLPGDIFNLHARGLVRNDHSVATISNATLVEVSPAALDGLMARPNLAQALAREVLIDGAIQRTWTASFGQRTAIERVSHLLCEIFFRLRIVGQVSGLTCAFPLTQMQVAEATGLSVVHVNRTLQELRRAEMIKLNRGGLTMLDLETLCVQGLFNANYLCLDGAGHPLCSSMAQSALVHRAPR